jgi:hypothetical protein
MSEIVQAKCSPSRMGNFPPGLGVFFFFFFFLLLRGKSYSYKWSRGNVQPH